MNIWMIARNSMKYQYLEKNISKVALNIEDITYADYVHAKRVCKDFGIKNLEERCDF